MTDCVRTDCVYAVKKLVSNVIGEAKHLDASLLNAWGCVDYDHSLWIASNRSGEIQHYDYSGKTISQSVIVPTLLGQTSPLTGMIRNTSSGFVIYNVEKAASPTFLVCTEFGTVAGYNKLVNENSAVIVINSNENQSVYYGLAMANDLLFLADFYNNRIDVYNFIYNLVIGYPFIDTDSVNPLPADYAPYNIVYLNKKIFVLYAKQDEDKKKAVAGDGFGYISVFDKNGAFIKRFASEGVLNAPWGMIYVKGVGYYVGNSGNGKINVFSEKGTYIKTLNTFDNEELIIDGLHGLSENKCGEIYYASGPDNNQNGLVGYIKKLEI